LRFGDVTKSSKHHIAKRFALLLTISGLNPGQEYRIFNSAGLLIHKAVMRTGDGKVDISPYSPGLYFFSVAGNRAVAFVKE
jgi:hypothetical protein